jgi:hypothetical protein
LIQELEVWSEQLREFARKALPENCRRKSSSGDSIRITNENIKEFMPV